MGNNLGLIQVDDNQALARLLETPGRHCDPVFVSEHYARVFEDTSDRWVRLPADFGLCPPDRPQHTVVISCTGRASRGPEYAGPR